MEQDSKRTMKRIGIIGGMSPESTVHYYREINRQVRNRAGGHTSADLVLRSVNFQEYVQLMEVNDWDGISEKLQKEAISLCVNNSCDYVAIATNTMHKVADSVIGPHKFLTVDSITGEKKSNDEFYVPLVHIGDCIAEECQKKSVTRVAILGTRFTMSQAFMRNRLTLNGLEVVVDAFTDSDIETVDRIIFNELCQGVVKSQSKEAIFNIMARATNQDIKTGGPGIDGFILGCTELDMLDDGEPYCAIEPIRPYKTISSTGAHINKLVELCLGEQSPF